VIAPLFRGGNFWNDPLGPPAKTAHVYLYPGFATWGLAFYLFAIIPIVVWFFGKRYCSWFCACGNLAESVGVTTWGKKWVREGTPRGKSADNRHWIQLAVMVFAFVLGFLLLFDGWRVIQATDLIARIRYVQDFVIDLVFASIIGVGAYPLFGTRLWCRYGCPLAKFMGLFGRFSRSRYQITANEKCTGIGLCTKTCPMGIDVASFAHKNKKPILGSWGLQNTVCIGCGGCIEVCPTKALAFKA
jgi:polyferredoxin